jgi:hypothetical protein
LKVICEGFYQSGLLRSYRSGVMQTQVHWDLRLAHDRQGNSLMAMIAVFGYLCWTLAKSVVEAHPLHVKWV